LAQNEWDRERKGKLFHNLEFTRFKDISIDVPDLENVDAPVEILEVYGDLRTGGFGFVHLFTHEVENQQGAHLVCLWAKFEVDDYISGVGVEKHRVTRRICQAGCRFLLRETAQLKRGQEGYY